MKKYKNMNLSTSLEYSMDKKSHPSKNLRPHLNSQFGPGFNFLLAPKLLHIVPCGKFHRIGGAPPETFPNVKHDAPEEVGGDRTCFDSPFRK